jgi:hypothetical protein
MQGLGKIRTNKDSIHKGVLMVAHEKKGLVKRNFFKVRIENSSEKNPECKGGKDKF